jgi:hypothetical protein
MSSLERGLLGIISGTVLGLAFMEGLDRPQLRIALTVVAAVIVGAAACLQSVSFGTSTLTLKRLSLPLFGVGSLVFMVNLSSVVLVDSTAEVVFYVVGTTTLIGCGLAYLLGMARRVVWYGFLVSYAVMILALVVDIVPFGNFTDVQLFQHDAVAALLRGDNPFSLTFPDIYPPAASARFYAEGVSVNGILQFGYPYFPFGLLVIAPFELLADFRIAHAIALVIAAYLISRMGDRYHSTVAAMLFVLASPSIVAARNGWSDPLVLLSIVVVVAVAMRATKGVSVATGFLFSVKQYTVFLVVPSLLLFERPWSLRVIVRHFAIAGAVFLLFTLPFVVWNPTAFWNSVVELQFIQPFRPDSVALPAMIPELWLSLPPVISIGAPFFAVAAASVAVMIRTPTGGQGFALGVAFVLLVAFLSSKQAFVNYYLVVIGALFAAAAASTVDGPDTTPIESPDQVPRTKRPDPRPVEESRMQELA